MASISKYERDGKNLVIEEALTVTYSNVVVRGSWGYTSANVSGWYNAMREIHRYARKSFKYVGMTYEAAVACRDDMVALFMRKFKNSTWLDATMGGGWVEEDAGEMPMADVALTHGDGDVWSVSVRVNEDDVRWRRMADYASVNVLFADERKNRSYGSNGEGSEDEREVAGDDSGKVVVGA